MPGNVPPRISKRQVYSSPSGIGSLLIGGPCTKTRRVEFVPLTLTIAADTILPISGLAKQFVGSMLSAVLSNVMSLPVPATSAPSVEPLRVTGMSTGMPAKPTPLPRLIRMLIGVGVMVGVSVTVGVSVAVGVSVGVSVLVGVSAGVAVSVGVALAVTVPLTSN